VLSTQSPLTPSQQDESMKVNEKKIAAVSALAPDRRYLHFIKVVTDREKLWGLYDDGWAMGQLDDGPTPIFMLWPEQAYAELCKLDDWVGYRAKSIDLTEFMKVFLPNLEASGALPGIFLVPGGAAVTAPLSQLRGDLEEALKRY
jgi:hypothetical protein